MLRSGSVYGQTARGRGKGRHMDGLRSRHRRRDSLLALGAALSVFAAALLGVAAPAFAGPAFSLGVGVSPTVKVGDTRTMTVTFQNQSASDPALGEVEYENDSYRLTSLTLVLSCGSQTPGADCPVGAKDPGVLVPNPLTATGRAGTVCSGRTFAIAPEGPPADGKYSLTPDQPIVLGAASDPVLSHKQCIVDVTYEVRQSPTIDSFPCPCPPGQAGLQTDQKGFATFIDVTPGTNLNQTGGGLGTNHTTVTPATPVIATVATPNFVLGAGQLADNATVTGIVSPVDATDSVEFRLYRGADCADANLILTRTDTTLTYNGTFTTGAADSGAPFDPPGPGTYRWRAFYSGDVNNAPTSGACNAPNENTIVSLASPTIATIASPDIVLGAGQLTDNATVTGLVSPVAAQDEVVFRLYRGADCADANLILTRTDATLTYNGTSTQGAADSGAPFDPPGAGTYRWRAFYSGDDNNNPVAGPCNAPNENTTVSPAAPAIATVATTNFVLGTGQLSDTATVTGLVNPVAAQDEVVFRLYRGADCADANLILTRTDTTLTYNPALTQGAADSGAPFDPPGAGTYRWRAFYSGDDNNVAIAGPCNAPSENTVVAPNSPSIATVATPNFVLGAGQLSDNATVSGLVNPVAAQDEVVFRLYRGADCADANLILTRTDTTLTYNGASTQGAADSGAPFDPPGAGTYRWRAFYSGDDNNIAVAGPCNAPNENTVVAPASPSIATVATPNFVLGAGQLSDNATVSGLVNPVSAQDEVVFRLYRGADCADANLILTRTDTSLNYNATSTQGAADSGTRSIRRVRAPIAGGRSTAATTTTSRSPARATRRTRTRSLRRPRRRSRRSRPRTSCWAPASSATTRRSAAS